MEHEDRAPHLKVLVWGVFLIVFGGAFLLDRLGVLAIPSAGDLWPLVFFAIGTIHLIERRPGSATMFMLIGAWFFACTFGWWGLSYRNSWGLVLVAAGVGMVVRALSGEESSRRLRRKQEAGHE